MSVYPDGDLPPAVVDAIERLEAGGLAVVVSYRVAMGGSWSTAFANPLIGAHEFEPEMVRSMSAKVAAKLLQQTQEVHHGDR